MQLLYWKVFQALTLPLFALAFRNGLLDWFGNNPQFSFTLAGSFAIHMATRPARSEIAVTILMGLLLRFGYVTIIGVNPYFGSTLISSAGFVGTASLFVLAYNAFQNKCFSVFRLAAFFPFVSIITGFILPITNDLSPVTFDAHLLAVDGTLGFQPSFFLGSIINKYPLLWHITATIYYALPLPIAILCADAQQNEHVSEVRRLLCLFGVMSVVGFCIYAACPATGPKYAFSEWFPLRPPLLTDILLAPLSVHNAPRNALPSLHLSAALLVYWNTMGMRKASRLAAGLFLVGTAFAILALGEHYVIDIIVAVPFSVFFQATFTRPNFLNSTWRCCAMLGSAGFVVAWLIMLRFWIHPLIVWPAAIYIFSIITLVFSILVLRKLYCLTLIDEYRNIVGNVRLPFSSS